MHTGRYSTLDFDNLPEALIMKYDTICKGIERNKTPLTELSMLNLEALVWYYRAQMESFDYQPPESWNEEKIFREEDMRCAEVIAHIFQRQYQRTVEAYEKHMAVKVK